MSERKVLNKYYPPDYDPSKVPRVKRKNKQNDVRTMAPFNMRCSTCGNYIAAGTKFNAKKETVENETYNKLLIFRFYIKCPRCMTAIIFRTDLKEHSYVVEHGATENFQALKLAEQKAREEAEAEEEEEKIDPMKQLENRTKASKKQMESSEQIQQLRSIKRKQNSVDIDSLIQDKRQEAAQEARPAIAAAEVEDDEIREEAKRLFRDGCMSAGTHKTNLSTSASTSGLGHPIKKSSSSVLSNLKKKIKVLPKTTSSKIDET